MLTSAARACWHFGGSVGINLVSGCHRCERKQHHEAGEEQLTIGNFYKAHRKCMIIDPYHVETIDDDVQFKPWIEFYKNGQIVATGLELG